MKIIAVRVLAVYKHESETELDGELDTSQLKMDAI